MSDILGLALGPVVSCSAPASRPLAPSANSSIQKYSADHIQLPIVLDFHSDKGKEEIRKWYHRQPTTRFMCVEHRKDTNGRFRHEFVVVYLDNQTVCRFDRRAREDMRGHALKDEGTISEDSAHVITLADTESQAHLDESEVLMSTQLHWKQDLNFILTVCCGIQSHPKAKSYSLLYYNCYFFSWTLVATISRQTRKRELAVDFNQMWRVAAARITEWIEEKQVVSFMNKNTRPTLGTELIRLGRSVMGVDSHQESLPPPVNLKDYIYRGIKERMFDISPSITQDGGLEKVLFRSQFRFTLRSEILLALQEGSRLGAQQFVDEAEAPRYVNL
ncbi:hypothetical protein RSAG8_12096, partial [Rhizoctonia solani AG-8 WAC10335]